MFCYSLVNIYHYKIKNVYNKILWIKIFSCFDLTFKSISFCLSIAVEIQVWGHMAITYSDAYLPILVPWTLIWSCFLSFYFFYSVRDENLKDDVIVLRSQCQYLFRYLLALVSKESFKETKLRKTFFNFIPSSLQNYF